MGIQIWLSEANGRTRTATGEYQLPRTFFHDLFQILHIHPT